MCPVEDRRGQTWEEISEAGQEWGGLGGPERFIVVGSPILLAGSPAEDPDSWWHPVLWIDDCGPSAEVDPEQNGMNEMHFTNKRYVRLA